MVWFALLNVGLGFATTIGLGIVAVLRRGWPRLTGWSLTQPLYWLMISAASYRALFHLVLKPHMWEKTRHGTRRGRQSARRLSMNSAVLGIEKPPSYSLLAYAMVESSAFSAWRESSRVCCTTMGTFDSITLA